MSIESDVEKFLQPIEGAVTAAIADLNTKAEAEKTAIASDVKAVAADAVAAVKGSAPEVEAAAKAVFDAVIASLKAHGL
jgi:hypothetical protein